MYVNLPEFQNINLDYSTYELTEQFVLVKSVQTDDYFAQGVFTENFDSHYTYQFPFPVRKQSQSDFGKSAKKKLVKTSSVKSISIT